MLFAGFFVAFVMGLFTVLMVQQRVTLKPLRYPNNTAATLYEASMPLGLVGAVLTVIWLAIGFNAESIQGVWLIGLVLFANFTILTGIVMYLVFDAGNRIRKEHKRLKEAYEAQSAQSHKTGR
jgi:amino acid transporter